MFNAKGLTLLSLAIAMLCVTPQTTRAVLIDFEDIPLGTEYSSSTLESSVITASGVQLFLVSIAGSGRDEIPSRIWYSDGRIVERSFGVPDGQVPGNGLELNGSAGIHLQQRASSITFVHSVPIEVWINGELSPLANLLSPDNPLQEFDLGGVHVVRKYTPAAGYSFDAIGQIDTFSFDTWLGMAGDGVSTIDDIDITYVPEPATMLIMGTGFLCGFYRK